MLTKRPYQHGNLRIKIGVGKGNLGRIETRELSVDELCHRLSQPFRDDITLADYLALPLEEQGRLKGRKGFWLGGPSRDGRRRNESLDYRSCITLDCDAASPEILDQLLRKLSKLCRFCFFIHTTRKHTPEKPRIRIVIFLTKPCPVEKYAPVARILAEMVDQTMDTIDDVSFRNVQMMFWPSVCTDSEFVFHQNEGELCDVDQVLAEWGQDWRDYTKLPHSEKQGKKRPSDPGRKAEHPHTKRGLVGAFCRTYSIEDAIDTFLPDRYAPSGTNSGKPRYSYSLGTGPAGATVEDDGLFLYSWHGSDPVTERLVNSFDLVRIHLFGDLDAGVDENEARPTDLPSYKKMEELCADIPEITQELVDERYADVAVYEDLSEEPETDSDPADDFENLDADNDDDDLIGASSPPQKTVNGEAYDGSWFHNLVDFTKDGVIRNSLPNQKIIIQHDLRIGPALRHNEFVDQVVIVKPIDTRIEHMHPMLVYDRVNGDRWEDRHTNTVRLILESPNGPGKHGYGLKVTDRDIDAAIKLAAEKNRFHPVRDYFNRLTWDRQERLDTFFIRWLGAPDTAYVRAVTRNLFLAAVARTFEPGHKFDFLTVLEGNQGKGKSTFIRYLAKNWFRELQTDLSNRNKLVEAIRGALLVEFPELATMTRADANDAKAVLSAHEDVIREPYARLERVYKRQCVFIATTNDTNYLKDTTGNRRMWPIECRIVEIDLKGVLANVDQLWAEAVTVYREMRAVQPHGELPLYLSGEAAQVEGLLMQESRRAETEADATAGQIEQWLETPVEPHVLDGGEPGFSDLDDLIGTPKVRREAVSLIDIWCNCLGNDRKHYGRHANLTLSAAMRLLGWSHTEGDFVSHPKEFGRQRAWRKSTWR